MFGFGASLDDGKCEASDEPVEGKGIGADLADDVHQGG